MAPPSDSVDTTGPGVTGTAHEPAGPVPGLRARGGYVPAPIAALQVAAARDFDLYDDPSGERFGGTGPRRPGPPDPVTSDA